MTRKEIAEMLNSIGIPTAYYQFPDDTGQEPPFICFYYPNNLPLFADNKNYYGAEALRIELYTDNKDFDLEATLEDVLADNELPFQKTERYIGSEKMFQITYETEVFIHEQE